MTHAVQPTIVGQISRRDFLAGGREAEAVPLAGGLVVSPSSSLLPICIGHLVNHDSWSSGQKIAPTAKPQGLPDTIESDCGRHLHCDATVPTSHCTPDLRRKHRPFIHL